MPEDGIPLFGTFLTIDTCCYHNLQSIDVHLFLLHPTYLEPQILNPFVGQKIR
jgi:hypothetical protein